MAVQLEYDIFCHPFKDKVSVHSKNKVRYTILADHFLKVHHKTKTSFIVTTLTSETQGLYTPNTKAHSFFPYPHIPNPHQEKKKKTPTNCKLYSHTFLHTTTTRRGIY
jgi:hypothetical protein